MYCDDCRVRMHVRVRVCVFVRVRVWLSLAICLQPTLLLVPGCYFGDGRGVP